MKVLEVCQEYPNKYYPQFGTFIKQSIDSIVDENVDVTVVSPKPMTLPFPIFPYYNFYRLPTRECTSRYEIHYPRYLYCVPKKYLYQYTGRSYSHFVFNYVNKNIKPEYDLIHAHFSYPDGYGMIKLASKWKVPLVISALGTIERKVAFEGTKTSKMIIESLHFADRILSVSDDLKKRMVNLGIDESKIHVVPNGVDTNRFKPTDKISARMKLKMPTNKKIVLYVGSLRKIKGVDYLVESANKFLDDSTILLLIGRDDGLKKKLIKRAKQLSILEHIQFIDQVSHNDIPLWISASDLLVLPSLSEGRPNVVLEAMSCGVAVIATNVGGTPELIKDKINGFLVEPCNPDELSEKISILLNDEDLRIDMGINGRKYIIENDLTWRAHGEQTVRVYNSLF